MPRQETTLTVFVASPSDVSDERERLQDVIDEINLTRSRDLGMRLELAKWETHALPGFGSDPQDVINDSIPQDYDIFIGIMWQRFGTPTLRATSGTLEEFQLAKGRFDKDPNSVRIMMYFKDAPLPPSRIDPDQIKAISEFRKTLGPQGGLYWVFDDTDQFEKLVRIHLQKAMQDWSDRGFAPPTHHPIAIYESTDTDSVEEPGLLDLTIEFTERFAEAGVQMGQSNAIMNDATARLTDLGTKLSHYGSNVNSNNMRQIKKLTTDVATAFGDFDRDFYKAANAAADNVEAGIDAMIKFVEMQKSLRPQEEESVVGLIQVMDTAQNSIEGYRNQIAATAVGLDSMPPITREINKAKRSLLVTLSKVVDRQDRSVALTKELKQALFSLLHSGSGRSQ